MKTLLSLVLGLGCGLYFPDYLQEKYGWNKKASIFITIIIIFVGNYLLGLIFKIL